MKEVNVLSLLLLLIYTSLKGRTTPDNPWQKDLEQSLYNNDDHESESS